MMKKWGAKPLENLLLLCDSGTWGPLSSPDEGYPILRSTNISREWTLDLSGDVAYRKIEDAKAERYQLELGDIIVTKSSGSAHLIGQAALFDVQSKRPYLFSNFTQRLRPNHDLVLSEYLYFYLRSPQARQVIDKMHRTTSGLRNLKLDDYKSQLVPVPYPKHPERSLAEQRRIVARLEALLGEVRAVRELVQSMQADIERVMESALAEVFGDLSQRFQNLKLDHTLERNDAKIKLCTVIPGQHILSKDYNTTAGGVPYVTGPADFGLKYPIIKRWTESPKVLCRPGDVLLTVKGSGVGKVNSAPPDVECAIGRQIMALRPNTEVLVGDYLLYFLQSKFQAFQQLRRGAAIPGIRKSQVTSINLPVPPKEVQAQTVAYLDAIQDEVNTAREQIARDLQSIEQLEQSILAAAFRGEL